MLPKGWIRCKFGDIASFKNGLNFTKSDQGESIKIVGVSDFQNRTELANTDELATIRVATKVRENELLRSGDLLFVRSNGNKALIGRCLFFPSITERLAYSGFTIRGRVDRNVIAPNFASNLVRSKVVTDQIFQGGSGTNISNLSQEILANVIVKVPPLWEQERIARVLAIWDGAIATTELLLASSRKQKRALMQSLLATQHRTNGLKSKFGRMNASDIFAPQSVRKNGGLELLSVMQDIGVVPRRLLDRKVAMPEGSTAGYKLVKSGDFVISLRSFEGGLEYSRYTGLVSPAYTVLNPRITICDDFYRHYFKSSEFIKHLAVAVIGIRDGKQISYDDFAFLKLPYPDIREQREIASVLNSAESIVNQLQIQIDRTKSEKKALMTDLLTGKRRVRLADSAPEAAA